MSKRLSIRITLLPYLEVQMVSFNFLLILLISKLPQLPLIIGEQILLQPRLPNLKELLISKIYNRWQLANLDQIIKIIRQIIKKGNLQALSPNKYQLKVKNGHKKLQLFHFLRVKQQWIPKFHKKDLIQTGSNMSYNATFWTWSK